MSKSSRINSLPTSIGYSFWKTVAPEGESYQSGGPGQVYYAQKLGDVRFDEEIGVESLDYIELDEFGSFFNHVKDSPIIEGAVVLCFEINGQLHTWGNDDEEEEGEENG